jgi:hypothetical protein
MTARDGGRGMALPTGLEHLLNLVLGSIEIRVDRLNADKSVPPSFAGFFLDGDHEQVEDRRNSKPK